MTPKEILDRLPAFEKLVEVWGDSAKTMAGNCYAVSTVLHKLMGGISRLVYGHVVITGGPSRKSGWHRHGWVQYRNWVIDPTRWQFTAQAPGYYIAPIDSTYDEGGWSRFYDQPIPEREENPEFVLRFKQTAVARVLQQMFFLDDRDCSRLTEAEVQFLAHVPPPALGPVLKLVYKELLKKHSALVPVDSRAFYAFVEEHGWDALEPFAESPDESEPLFVQCAVCGEKRANRKPCCGFDPVVHQGESSERSHCVQCAECLEWMGDMGGNVRCEHCGQGPMPTAERYQRED